MRIELFDKDITGADEELGRLSLPLDSVRQAGEIEKVIFYLMLKFFFLLQKKQFFVSFLIKLLVFQLIYSGTNSKAANTES